MRPWDRLEEVLGLFVSSNGGVYRGPAGVPVTYLRWYAFSYYIWELDGAMFYPIGLHFVMYALQWCRVRIYYRILRAIAASGHMDIKEYEVLQVSKIRLRRVRQPLSIW